MLLDARTKIASCVAAVFRLSVERCAVVANLPNLLISLHVGVRRKFRITGCAVGCKFLVFFFFLCYMVK